MNQTVLLNRLTESGIVAVIRKPQAAQIVPIAEALIAGGVGALEITVDTDGGLEMIQDIKRKFGDRVLVGAGTVLDLKSAQAAIDAGSDFIFSPTLDEQVIKLTKNAGLLSIPGVMTPTEILSAYQAGADILKIFPGGSLGAGYIKELQGPLGHIPMMPTGGVTLGNVAAFIRSGAVAAGIGGSLVNKQAIEEERYDILRETARQFVNEIQKARGRG